MSFFQKTNLPSSETVVNQTQNVLNQYLPKIQHVFQKHIKPGVLTAAQNDNVLQPVCKLAYSTLPFPVRLIVSEDKFVDFCLANRDKLVAPAVAI
ncbi:MAG: hypothetical protein HY774_10310 [Acidobacteria bacterium]|nr:hypothetical protein [Acidobacteriota bacterium]